MSADESCSDHALMDQIMFITRFWIILGVTSKMYLWLASAETTFVVNRDNSTFEIVLQQPLDCPEMFYLYMPSQGEFFRRDDGRDVKEDSRKLCIKCTRCLDGVQVMRKCNQYQDVECGVKCLEPGYRFDEGTRSCQHEKVLDDGFTHDELRKWLAEQSRGRELVSEVGIKKSTHIVTTTSSRRRTTEVTSKRHSHGTLSTSKGTTQKAITHTSDVHLLMASDVTDIDAVAMSENGDTNREHIPLQASVNHTAKLQKLLLIAAGSLLVVTMVLYACVAIKKFQPRIFLRLMASSRPSTQPVTFNDQEAGPLSWDLLIPSRLSSAKQTATIIEDNLDVDGGDDWSFEDEYDYDNDDDEDTDNEGGYKDDDGQRGWVQIHFPSPSNIDVSRISCVGDVDTVHNLKKSKLGDTIPNDEDDMSHADGQDDGAGKEECGAFRQTENGDDSNYSNIMSVQDEISRRSAEREIPEQVIIIQDACKGTGDDAPDDAVTSSSENENKECVFTEIKENRYHYLSDHVDDSSEKTKFEEDLTGGTKMPLEEDAVIIETKLNDPVIYTNKLHSRKDKPLALDSSSHDNNIGELFVCSSYDDKEEKRDRYPSDLSVCHDSIVGYITDKTESEMLLLIFGTKLSRKAAVNEAGENVDTDISISESHAEGRTVNGLSKIHQTEITLGKIPRERSSSTSANWMSGIHDRHELSPDRPSMTVRPDSKCGDESDVTITRCHSRGLHYSDYHIQTNHMDWCHDVIAAANSRRDFGKSGSEHNIMRIIRNPLFWSKKSLLFKNDGNA